ncbi:unnamed protein product [Thlaspi arvense]|uniref:NAD(P)H-quinone oxidoreductase subunit 2 N-terminal domain-containing protein n=1 Tax=Thlaspi arvense TaxID=13288 RepID=A0AAU9RWQ1_THLAR|nr:unnamed protein product [Thlaspi arvense]
MSGPLLFCDGREKKPMISFSGNFQMNNFNEIFSISYFTMFITLCILSIANGYNRVSVIRINSYCLGGYVFLCGANDLITILCSSLECFQFMLFYLTIIWTIPRKMYAIYMNSYYEIFTHGWLWWQASSSSGSWFSLGYMVHLGGRDGELSRNSEWSYQYTNEFQLALIFITVVNWGFKSFPSASPSHQ